MHLARQSSDVNLATVFVFASVTLREASRRRLLFAGALLGVGFVALYAFGFGFVMSNAPCGTRARPCQTPFQAAQFPIAVNLIALAGLYAANLLTFVTAVLLPVDTLSGEIASGVAQTLACKPVRRAEIVLGKWLAYWLIAGGYLCLTAGGVILATWAVSGYLSEKAGFLVPGIVSGLSLMMLEVTVLLTLTIAGGAFFSTVTNGLVTFGIFGLGFLGGWVEQIGEVVVQSPNGLNAIRNIGTIVSLIIPSDGLWRLAAYRMMPPLARNLGFTPFTSLFPPTGALAIWATGYVVVVLVVALRQFDRRAL
jgi:Cu-processing system permease protein